MITAVGSFNTDKNTQLGMVLSQNEIKTSALAASKEVKYLFFTIRKFLLQNILVSQTVTMFLNLNFFKTCFRSFNLDSLQYYFNVSILMHVIVLHSNSLNFNYFSLESISTKLVMCFTILGKFLVIFCLIKIATLCFEPIDSTFLIFQL